MPLIRAEGCGDRVTKSARPDLELPESRMIFDDRGVSNAVNQLSAYAEDVVSNNLSGRMSRNP